MGEDFMYTRLIKADEMALMEHYVVDAKGWIDTAITEKIENCRRRIIKEEMNKAIENDLPLPPRPADLVTAVFSSKDYMSRRQRDEEQSATLVEATVDPEPVDGVKEDGQPT
jgi:hypothetical protein